ncbi:DNA-binding transcriptional repressor MarR [compost metagenome]
MTESRIIFEIGVAGEISARKLKDLLFIDEGYLSRLIANLVKNGMINKSQSTADKRIHVLSLTVSGKNLLDEINRKSNEQLEALLSPLSINDQHRVAEITAELKHILSKEQSIRAIDGVSHD